MMRDVDVDALARTVREKVPALASIDIATLFAPGVAAIATRWPGVTVDPAFADHVAARLVAQKDPATAVAKLHIDDLFVAWWAGTGRSDGLAAFDVIYGSELDRIAGRFRDLPRDELGQQLRIRLFVGDKAKILEYAGTGPLLAWLRVVAVRAFVDIARSARSHQYHAELDEVELLGLPQSDDLGPSELGNDLRAALKLAFAEAVANLAPRQRTFLRHAYVDRLTLDQIADTYSIHRATVARILASARAQLIEQTRAGIVAKLGVAPGELASALGTLDRRLELSLSRILKTP